MKTPTSAILGMIDFIFESRTSFYCFAVSAFTFFVLTFESYAQVIKYDELPSEVRFYVENVRRQCSEASSNVENNRSLQGIQPIIIGNARAIIVDNRELCSDHFSGFNCSNRGCDLKIWREGSFNWTLIFDEHVHRSFIGYDRENLVLRFIAISIYGGNPKCKPDTKRNYTSGQSCDLILTYKNGGWEYLLPR